MPNSLYGFERRFWREGIDHVAGVDEAGRGPLAGPVVACAVILGRNKKIRGLNDSKQLKPEVRESLFVQILETSQVGLGLVSEKIIDRVNIFQASRLAMRQAILNLPEPPQALLVDGRMHLDFPQPKLEIIHGDCLSASIAAASIVAKVMRDRIMLAYDELEPEYSFRTHKGYATEAHLAFLERIGPSPFHRQSFHPIRKEPQGVLL